MAKIWVYFICEILAFTNAIEPLDVLFCEDSRDGYAQVSCPENKTIGLKSIKYGESPCEDTNNRNICHSNINIYFDDHCLGQNNCTLPIRILSTNNCQRPSRRLEVKFECSKGWWSSNKHPKPVDTCANSLKEVNCPSGYHIHIKSAKSFNRTSGCHSMNLEKAKSFLEELCNENRRCSSDTSKKSLLYHKRFASIQYVCIGPTDRPVTESVHSPSTDGRLETTTFTTENISSGNDELPALSLDKNHRVVIYLHSKNQTQQLCSSEWDDDDAAVLCRHLNSTWIGNATVLDTLVDIPIANYSLHCNGFETSLFKCNVSKDETACNTTKVAGAMCCQGTNKLGECVTYPSPLKDFSRKSGSSTLVGVTVIVVSTLVFTIAIMIIVIVCYRKNRAKNSKLCLTHNITTATERINSSDYNKINFNEMTDIRIVSINDNTSETLASQHQQQNIKSSNEQDRNMGNKYESISVNRNSEEHFYDSDSIHINQYEFLTNPRESDKHTYESTEQALPQDINTPTEQEDNICNKYESLSTNRNSVEHVYESDSIHTNQYESLTKQREFDNHIYESTEQA